jgi:glycosyltransferase involved in cell wall biosynthesis
MTPKKRKVALLYDYLFSRGGAEKLSYSLLRGVPNSDFYVALRDEELFASNDLENGGGRLNVLTSYTSSKGWKAVKTMLVFMLKPPKLSEYDCAVYSGEYAPMALLRKQARAKRNIMYCHTIPRGPYDLYEHKLKQHTGIKLLAFIILSKVIKVLYGASMKHLDLIIANSENVRQRIKTYLGLEAVVVNPPIDTERFRWEGQGDYYLSTARLEQAKRVDLIIEAFQNMPDKKLIVASGGSEYERLAGMAEGYANITLTNWNSEEELHQLVGHCIATIYVPINEDFGMSPLESMSAGKPCIGVAEGGLLETVKHEKSGWLIDDLSSESICKAVNSASLETCLSMKDTCVSHAQNYSEAIFQEKIRTLVIENSL